MRHGAGCGETESPWEPPARRAAGEGGRRRGWTSVHMVVAQALAGRARRPRHAAARHLARPLSVGVGERVRVTVRAPEGAPLLPALLVAEGERSSKAPSGQRGGDAVRVSGGGRAACVDGQRGRQSRCRRLRCGGHPLDTRAGRWVPPFCRSGERYAHGERSAAGPTVSTGMAPSPASETKSVVLAPATLSRSLSADIWLKSLFPLKNRKPSRFTPFREQSGPFLASGLSTLSHALDRRGIVGPVLEQPRRDPLAEHCGAACFAGDDAGRAHPRRGQPSPGRPDHAGEGTRADARGISDGSAALQYIETEDEPWHATCRPTSRSTAISKKVLGDALSSALPFAMAEDALDAALVTAKNDGEIDKAVKQALASGARPGCPAIDAAEKLKGAGQGAGRQARAQV